MNNQSHNINKKAYVPLSPAAMDAAQMQPPMDPATVQQGGGMPPMPPMDPAMMQQGGGMPPMPAPGGTGQQIDPETGLVVVDPMQGIVMDPITGIMLNKQTGEFLSPDGQPIPPEQAMQMIEQAAAQGGAPMPPMDPAAGMMAEGMVPPEADAMASGMGTSLPAPPETLSAMGGGAAMGEADIETALPGFEDFLAKNEQQINTQDKVNKRMLKELAGARADMQGMRRELEQLEDTQDVLLARLTDVVDRFERAMGGPLNA